MMASRADQASLEYIRNYYGVPARLGGRVRYTWDGRGTPADGTIVGGHGGYLKIRLDGQEEWATYHPTWHIEYLDGPATAPPAGRDSGPVPGYRNFRCEECGHTFREPTRDCASPSLETCPCCAADAYPHSYDPHPEWPVNADGNLIVPLPPCGPVRGPAAWTGPGGGEGGR
jgi:hypothetical protein